MKKIFILILLLLIFSLMTEAKSIKRSIESVIAESDIHKGSVAISVKDLKTGKTVYGLNDQILMHPASVQKILTIVPIMEVLGNDYKFSTEIYLRGKSDYVLKLGADPYLKSSDLNLLVNVINPKVVKKLYIDDSVIEHKDWGEGWQWDDDMNIFMPKFNAYNLDGNLLKFTVCPTVKTQPAQIIDTSKANIVYVNNIITGDENNIKISRTGSAHNVVTLDGTVKTAVMDAIPNNNLKSYFQLKLNNALEDRLIYLKEPYTRTIVNLQDKKLSDVTHTVNTAINDILLNSNNMTIETLSKLAAGKYYNKQGTDIDGTNLFKEYCNKIGLNTDRIRIVDASGVSKNNLVNANFITDFLVKNQDNDILKRMAVPGTGTLINRLMPLKDNLRAKTGTLSDISGISGFLTTKQGNKFAFSIMINEPSTSSSEKKILEDYLIRSIYYKF